LSRLQLPKAVKEGFNDFVLHPSLMDGALQTVTGLMEPENAALYLPFALGSAELLGTLSEQSYAYVCRAGNADSAVKKFNISILDETGAVSVRLSDFSVRALKPQTGTAVTMYYQSVWKGAKLENQALALDAVLLFDLDDSRHSSFKERLSSEVILVTPGDCYQESAPQKYSVNPGRPADYQKLLAALTRQNAGLPGHIIHLWSQAPFVNDEAALNAQLDMSLFSVFHLSQAIFAQKPSSRIQLLYIYLETEEARQPQYAALSGFAKTVRLENSRFDYKTIAVQTLDKVMDIVSAEFQVSDAVEIRYDDSRRQVRHLQEFDGAADAQAATL
ncbi:MAG: hypothetical protein GY862_39790, partial [Gammaproteobacteria bacterium]|nr:hypothetical protein [Gammaproteobacteria bacterium]